MSGVFKDELFDKLREYVPAFASLQNADITAQLLKGKELHDAQEEFARPEDTLSEEELIRLGAYVEYKTLVESERLKDQPDGDDFNFEPSDLVDEQ